MSDKQCSGKCLPLYLFGAISALGIGTQFAFSKRKTFKEKLSDSAKTTLWVLLYGALIYFICKTCKPLWAYGLLSVPSLLFGFNMFWLLITK